MVEEGIDVQSCNQVVRFDSPQTLSSYIQSKGRARHKDSKYIIFALDGGKKPYPVIHETFKMSERKLTEVNIIILNVCYSL